MPDEILQKFLKYSKISGWGLFGIIAMLIGFYWNTINFQENAEKRFTRIETALESKASKTDLENLKVTQETNFIQLNRAINDLKETSQSGQIQIYKELLRGKMGTDQARKQLFYSKK